MTAGRDGSGAATLGKIEGVLFDVSRKRKRAGRCGMEGCERAG